MVDFSALSCAAKPELSGAVPLRFDPKKETVSNAILDGKAGCLEAANGTRVLYKVFELPQTDAPYIVRLTAAPWGDTILAPRAQFLDSDGGAKRSTGHADFTFRGNTLAAFLRSHADEKFLVVSSDPDVLGTSVSRINESVRTQAMSTGMVFFTMYTGSDTATNLVLSPAGNVGVTLSPVPAK
jgi:hypothetical protein